MKICLYILITGYAEQRAKGYCPELKLEITCAWEGKTAMRRRAPPITAGVPIHATASACAKSVINMLARSSMVALSLLFTVDLSNTASPPSAFSERMWR